MAIFKPVIIMDKYYVYVMSNKNNTALYVGVTNDIERRVVEHRTYDIKSFTCDIIVTNWYISRNIVASMKL